MLCRPDPLIASWEPMAVPTLKDIHRLSFANLMRQSPPLQPCTIMCKPEHREAAKAILEADENRKCREIVEKLLSAPGAQNSVELEVTRTLYGKYVQVKYGDNADGEWGDTEQVIVSVREGASWLDAILNALNQAMN